MAIIYKVTIGPAEKVNRFHITWHNLETNTEDYFEQSSEEIKPDEMVRLWQQPRHHLDVGRELFRFLDGDSRCLERALEEAHQQGESLLLNLCACKETADWPFELLAREDTFLLPHRLHLVRRISDWGQEKKIIPWNRPLKLLFMACSAPDIEPELDFQREEEAIFRVTEELPIDMEVDDSGSPEGLRRQLKQTEYDVVHLSGHADIDKNGQPYFIMECETGEHRKISPGELWNESLIENPPRLLFLSGCRTGETPDTGASGSFARMLVENYNVPAVLGWGRSVADEQATHAEEVLYDKLSCGKSILDAVQRVRYELVTKYESKPYPTWPLLRLFSSGISLDAIVEEGQQRRPQPRQMVHIYLANSLVQVLAEGFVGRRRQLQRSLQTLKQASNKVGLLLLGTGGLGKSCLAGKISERLTDHTLVIVHGRLNAITLEAALKDAFIISQDEKGKRLLSQKIEASETTLIKGFCGGSKCFTGGFLENSLPAVEDKKTNFMTDKLANLCATSFKEKKYLLLLDDFEQNLEGADKGQPGSLILEAADLIKTLLHFLPFSGKMTQLIITSRYSFSLTEQARDLVEERIEKIWLTNFPESERRKKARELKNILYYSDQSLVPRLLWAGHGNPRLMEWLDLLVGQMKTAEVPHLLEAIKDKQEEFIRAHVIRELLQRGGKGLALFLQWLSIYRRPVQEEGVQQVAQAAEIQDWKDLLQEGMSLSLIEHDQAKRNYQLTPLLREELLCKLKDIQPCHQAAFEYYKRICEARDSIDPVLTEEWIFHALGCGQEKTASQQGSHLVKYLRSHLAFQESRRIGKWILDEKKQVLANEDDAFLLNEIASTLKNLAQYKTAVKYYQQALDIVGEAVVHKDLNIVSTIMNNLGTTWYDRGNYRKAIKYFEQTLVTWKKLHGARHPNVAILLNNLGAAWYNREDYHKAIKYYEEALTIWKTVYGETHPNTAAALNKLGESWRALDKTGKAIGYFEEALSIVKTVLGEKHPNAADVLDNLGTAWRFLEEYENALGFYEQALSINQSALGKVHPNVGGNLANLGKTYLALGQKEKAKRYFEDAYAIFKEVYGAKHSFTKAAATLLEKVRDEIK
jgi:tetratricopeptide (TPR) repeat protein